jgi:chaperonin GroES
MNIQPLGNRVLVQPTEEDEQSPGGIYIPKTVSNKPTKGTVIAVGRGRALDGGGFAEMSVAEGDVVLYGKYSGNEIKVDGKDLVLFAEDDILAIISE